LVYKVSGFSVQVSAQPLAGKVCLPCLEGGQYDRKRNFGYEVSYECSVFSQLWRDESSFAPHTLSNESKNWMGIARLQPDLCQEFQCCPF